MNFVDIYERKGLYPLTLPAIAGKEGAGIIEAVGPNVEMLRPGDRVAPSDRITSSRRGRIAPVLLHHRTYGSIYGGSRTPYKTKMSIDFRKSKLGNQRLTAVDLGGISGTKLPPFRF